VTRPPSRRGGGGRSPGRTGKRSRSKPAKTGGTDKPWWKLCGFVLIYLPLGLAVAGFLTAKAFLSANLIYIPVGIAALGFLTAEAVFLRSVS